MVNHVVGPMNLGTLIVGPREHVVAVADLYGGLRGEQIQARMLASGEEPDAADVERICARARQLFLEMAG